MKFFSVFELSFNLCLTNLSNVFWLYVEKKLVLSREKSHFTREEGIMLGYNINKSG